MENRRNGPVQSRNTLKEPHFSCFEFLLRTLPWTRRTTWGLYPESVEDYIHHESWTTNSLGLVLLATLPLKLVRRQRPRNFVVSSGYSKFVYDFPHMKSLWTDFRRSKVMTLCTTWALDVAVCRVGAVELLAPQGPPSLTTHPIDLACCLHSTPQHSIVVTVLRRCNGSLCQTTDCYTAWILAVDVWPAKHLKLDPPSLW